jgi:hypothetical protein
LSWALTPRRSQSPAVAGGVARRSRRDMRSVRPDIAVMTPNCMSDRAGRPGLNGGAAQAAGQATRFLEPGERQWSIHTRPAVWQSTREGTRKSARDDQGANHREGGEGVWRLPARSGGASLIVRVPSRIPVAPPYPPPRRPRVPGQPGRARRPGRRPGRPPAVPGNTPCRPAR